MLITGVVNVLPAPIEIPPVETSYQITLPVKGIADSVREPGPQLTSCVKLVISFTVILALADISITGSPVVPPYSTMNP